MPLNQALNKIESVKKNRDLSLVMAEYELEHMPDEIHQLHWLESLFISFNSLSDITFLQYLPNLRKLDLRGNKIADIRPIAQLTELQFLDLDFNFIVDIDLLQHLKSLTTLYLSNNKINSIVGLGNLKNLTYLDLSHNDIEDVSALANLESLTTLFLKSNRIKDISSLATIPNLKQLNLAKNRVANISKLNNNKHLKNIGIGGNLIQDLTGIVDNFRDGMLFFPEIDLEEKPSNNPLTIPPPEIVAQGIKSIIKYFDELIRQGADRIYEAKLLIIGEGGVGKTSLVRKIQDKESNLPHESETTFGINIVRFPLAKMPDGKTFYLNIWDFGGQEIYHSTHQFFLTQRSLYALLDDTRKDDKGVDDSIFSYWLQITELLGGNSPLIIIQNEKGDRSKDIDIRGMQARFKFIKECKQTNLMTNRGLDAILDAIKYWSSHLPHIGETLPKQWVEIRKHIEALANSENHITIRDYLGICTKFKIPEEHRALTLSSYLHDLGIFLHYQDDKILRNTVILKNTWVTDAVYMIMDDEQIKKKQGFFTQEDLNRLWCSAQYKYQHPTLLALMEKFELCYKIPEIKSERWLAPQLLPVTSPIFDWDQSSNIQIKYAYEFMPKGLLSRLIVRLNRYLKHFDRAWRSGIFLERQHSEALIKEIYASKVITVNVRGPFAKEFATIISEELDSLNATFAHLKVRKLIPCNCPVCTGSKSPYFYAYDNLQGRILNNRTTVECDVSYKSVLVKSLLDDVFTTILRKKNEDMVLFISYAHEDQNYKEEIIKHLKSLKITENLQTWSDNDIMPGETWSEEIQRMLQTADIILLLISSDFIASSYIWEKELPIAIDRDKKGDAIVIPIFVRDCDTTDMPFMKLQGIPSNGKPIASFRNKDEAFTEISKAIRKRLNKIEKI